MAHNVLRKILHKIREAEVFAIIADEATNVSQKGNSASLLDRLTLIARCLKTHWD